MDIQHPYGVLQRRWRWQRMRAFVQRLGVTAQTRVLDLGGDSYNWRILSEVDGIEPQVTILNLRPPDTPDLPPSLTWVIGNALHAPFPDGAFDVVFSNSVIEHLGTDTAQQTFTREVFRLARAYWVQTPNRWFPMEPHLMCPFIHYLPHGMQRPLYPYTPWALLTPGVDRAAMDDQFASLKLLTRGDFARLFPGATMITEHVAGMPKCFVATSAKR